jgi:hypothetical protein
MTDHRRSQQKFDRQKTSPWSENRLLNAAFLKLQLLRQHHLLCDFVRASIRFSTTSTLERFSPSVEVVCCLSALWVLASVTVERCEARPANRIDVDVEAYKRLRSIRWKLELVHAQRV